MKIGIIGSGLIVRTALEVIKNIEDTRCTAMYCRTVGKGSAQETANEYGIDSLYDDIDAFLADDTYDVVYVGIINSGHYEFTKKALQAKKHVICEKAFTSGYQEAKELLDLARENQLFLFEAIMLRYLNNYREIKKTIPLLEDIKLIQCNYSQYSRRYDKYLAHEVLPAFDPELSGGCLYDINVYNVHFVVGLFGRPEKVHYFANIGYNGIDTSGILVLDYGSFKAVCCGAKDSASPAGSTIQGEKGYIFVDSMAGHVSNVSVVLKDQTYKIDLDHIENPMENEFRAIFDMIREKDYEHCFEYMELTLIVMEVLEAGRNDAGIVFAADRKQV